MPNEHFKHICCDKCTLTENITPTCSTNTINNADRIKKVVFDLPSIQETMVSGKINATAHDIDNVCFRYMTV